MISKQLARNAMQGVGDATLGEWEGVYGESSIWHVQRRLTDAERAEFGVPDPVDIRGTLQEQHRLTVALAERPLQ